MVQAILNTENPLSPDWLDLLMPLTEGNPFFVEEVTKSLVQTGAQSGQWDPLQIPRSLQQMVQRRVQDIPDRTRAILSLASVIGERFDFALLQEVAAVDEMSLLQVLKELTAAQLIVEKTADQYAFRHAITREVVYATLMLRERKMMHHRIGERIERFTERQAEASAASLAYHFYQAGDWQKALEYSNRAGERAQALYASREALTHFTHALEAAQQLDVASRFLPLRGRAHSCEVLGEFDHARVDYEAALDLASHGTNRVDEWQSLIDLGFLWQSRNLERAGEYYQRPLELARNLGDSCILSHTLNRAGNWYFNRGQLRQALPYHQEALALFQGENNRQGIAHSLDLLALVSYQLGEVIQGAEYLKQAVPILLELDDRQALVNTLINLTGQALIDTEVLGEINYLRLVDLSDEALQIAGSFHWYQGEVIALMQGAISLERASGLLIFAAKVHLATVAVLLNDFAGAHTLLYGLLPGEYPEGQEQVPLRRCWSVYAELELAQGNPRRALTSECCSSLVPSQRMIRTSVKQSPLPGVFTRFFPNQERASFW
jgi:tetratricopeptide (TPR) repeat protein